MAHRVVPRLQATVAATKDAKDARKDSDDAMTRPVAIIGEAGRFPQAADLDAFWRNLAEGRVCIGEVGPERWSLDAHYREGAPTAGYTNSKWLGALEDFDRFDPLFFSISPTEAESMDPQQRVFLEACWHALENAGRDPHGLSGARCGVFVGCGPSDYHQVAEHHRLSAQGFTGAATSILAARIAYALDLRGPCVSIDTACSSSLVAIAQACDSLNSGQSDLALAGGVYVMGGPSMHIMTAQAGMLSPDGRCHTFDANANGFVPGEGVGVVVLKRLDDALRDGDRIDAVIEGWGVNQDGRSNGITAPNQDAQTALLQSVYRRFGIDPDGLQLIEAHGTGTRLGDPIEVAGLKAAFAPFTQRAGFCALGSVKSNIGHCLTAAGIAGVLKLVLALRHRQLPPTVNFERINEHIQLDGSPFQVNAQLRDWAVPAGARRRSAVSSFGFSGTNAHLVITEAPVVADAPVQAAAGPVPVPLSARTPAQLRQSAAALLARLRADDAVSLDLQAIAWTLQHGRHGLGERVCFLVHDVAGLRAALEACVDDRAQPGVRFEGQVKRDRPGLGLLLQDEDVRQTVIGKWLSERRHDRLADVWAKGLDLDWRIFRPEGARTPRPLALPGYPFARDRYWLSLDMDSSAARRHPLLQENVSLLSRQRYRTRLRGDEATLRIEQDGLAVVSPFALLDMARAAMADATADLGDDTGVAPSIVLAEVAWSTPVPFAAGVELRVDLFALDDADGTDVGIGFEIGFEIRSDRSDAPHVHGMAVAQLPQPQRLDLDALRARIPTQAGDPPSLRRGTQEVLAGLAAPADAAAWGLHPAQAQAALDVAARLMGHAGTAVPCTLLQATVETAADGHRDAHGLQAWIRHGADAGSVDIDLLDDTGLVRARLQGLRMAASADAAPLDEADAADEARVHFTAPVWDSIGALPVEADRSAGKRVVAVNFDPAQCERLRAHYGEAQLRFATLDGSEDVATIAERLGEGDIDRLLWLARTSSPAANEDAIDGRQVGDRLVDDGVIADQSLGILQALRIARALVALGHETRALRWDMIAPGSIPTHRTDAVDPTHAGLQGFSGSLAAVYPSWAIRLIDAPAAETAALDGLDRLPLLPRNNCHALRGAGWYRQRLIEVETPAAESPSPYRDGGVYVVVGGAGGIGELWTRHVAARHRARVVWLGRRPLDEALRAKIDAIAAVGPAPLYLQADATDPLQLQAACAEIRSRFPAVHGVVHSAVGAFDQSLKTIAEADFRAVLAPKIDLSVRLAQAFDGEPLDFALFFSSNASFVRGAGMSGYSAGCSFKDAYAQCLAQRWSCPVKVVNWGYWTVGAGDAISDAMKHYFHESGYRPLDADEAMQALDTLLAGDFVQLSITRHLGRANADDGDDCLLSHGRGDVAAPLDVLRALDFSEAFAPFSAKAGAEMEPLLCRLLAGILGTTADVAPAFRRWRSESLAIVAAAGADDGTPLETLWQAWDAAMAGWSQDAGRAALCALVDACMRALPDILAGRRKPTDVIFPGASLAFVERVYKTDALSLAYNESLSETLVAAVRAQLERAPGTRLRMLEIGAGTGATTVGILAKLGPYADRIDEYCYTDLSKAFLFHAETHYAPGAPYLRTRLFDVEKPLSTQGIDPGSYDVVIAANVIHATRNIRNTIRNAKALLRRDGLLLMNEVSDHSISGHVTFGLLDGWWLNEDEEVRIPGSPGLYPERWQEVLSTEGFHVVLFPCRDAHFAGQQIVAAFADGVVRQRRAAVAPAARLASPPPRALPAPRPVAPARPVPSVAAPVAPIVSAAAQAAPIARSHASLRDETVRFCKQVIGRALKLAEHEIDAGEPLERYGIDSIIVGLVNQELHRQFGDIGSTLLFEHQTVDALADHLLATQRTRLEAMLAPRQVAPPAPVPAPAPTPAVQAPRASVRASVAPVTQASLRERTVDFCKRMLGRALKLEVHEIDAAEPLEHYGIDSIIVGLVNQELHRQFGDVGSTLLFEHRTVDALADHLLDAHRDRLETILAVDTTADTAAGTAPAAAPMPASTPATDAAQGQGTRIALRMRGRGAAARSTAPQGDRGPLVRQPIAIVGISGMYPGADDLDAFWEALKRGYDGIGDIPSRRWALEGFFDEDEHRAVERGMSYCKRGGFLERFAEFDALFFGIPPREAMNMDPQERLFIQTAWLALENAGYTRRTLREDFQRRVGVFAGITRAGYNLYRGTVGADEKFWPRTSFASVANRLSYLLDIQGPSLPVDTMCSSSLTAIHEACEHIHNGDCDVAIAGGVNLYLHPTSYVDMSSQHMLSRDGVCKSFGEGANGFVPGEGVGVAILKPLARAEADGDLIHGVILASHVNHGGRTNGFTVPNPTAQAELVRRAIDKAGISARAIGYIEAHGTGTELGDPIEIAGLQQAFSRDTADTGFCRIGSAKSNIGHLEAAAGIAGLTKALLQLRHGQIVPSLHCARINPHIRFERTAFEVNRHLVPWERPTIDGRVLPRIAGVSSFGAGGANAHVLLQEYLPAPAAMHGSAMPPGGRVLVPLSARSEEQLRQKAADLRDALRAAGDALALDEVACTLQIGREAMEERVALLVGDRAELVAQLDALAEGRPPAGPHHRGQVQRRRDAASAEAVADALADALRGQRLPELARLWVGGVEVDWRQLYPAGLPRRVALPGYPFARDEYWLDTFAGEDASLASGSSVQAAAVPPASTAAGRRDFGLIEDILGRIETSALDAQQGARLLKKLV
ncbi:MAG: SDR family NAD(P)-dependent oxidoreductase [Lysobacter sp.]|nr:SDR family NAD(P)-dependent oxidoreductase [Lysobacter sp.]